MSAGERLGAMMPSLSFFVRFVFLSLLLNYQCYCCLQENSAATRVGSDAFCATLKLILNYAEDTLPVDST